MSIRNVLVALALLLPAPLAAQGITIPNTFVNGTAADATQVNANFTSLANNALNRTGGTMTGTLTTVLVQPTVNNTSDLGTTSLLYRTGYVRTSLVLGQAAGNYTLTWANPAAARAISFEDPGGTDILVYKAATQTLTNKTLTAPVLSGTVTGTYTLGGTPTIPASGLTGAIPSPATIGGTAVASTVLNILGTDATVHSLIFGAASDANYAAVVGNYNGGSRTLTAQIDGVQISRWLSDRLEVGNTTLALPILSLTGTDATVHSLIFGAASDTNYASLVGNYNGGSRLLAVQIDGAQVSRWLSTGLQVNGTLIVDSTLSLGANVTDAVATPTISSGFGSGPSPSITGKVYAFILTMGGGSPNTGVVAFNMTFANPPAVVCSGGRPGADTVNTTSTTTSVTINTPAQTSGDKWHCLVRGF